MFAALLCSKPVSGLHNAALTNKLIAAATSIQSGLSKLPPICRRVRRERHQFCNRMHRGSLGQALESCRSAGALPFACSFRISKPRSRLRICTSRGANPDLQASRRPPRADRRMIRRHPAWHPKYLQKSPWLQLQTRSTEASASCFRILGSWPFRAQKSVPRNGVGRPGRHIQKSAFPFLPSESPRFAAPFQASFHCVADYSLFPME